MLQSEFNDRIGRAASPEEYDVANQVYMALSANYDKDKFCDLYVNDKRTYLELQFLAFNLIERQRECNNWKSFISNAGILIIDAVASNDSDRIDSAIDHLLGNKVERVMYKLENDMTLSEKDKDILIEILKSQKS